ncbi:MAG TPA: hypothetical protein VN442_07290, partial [Bryobacteraceae bacterium]|nr:hypothetical protein [Bryobacteraceae bacterium]
MKTMRSRLLLLALSSFSAVLCAQPAPPAAAAPQARKVAASPGAAFSAERLKRVDRLLQKYVDANQIAGAVALVLRDGKPVYERAVGWSD